MTLAVDDRLSSYSGDGSTTAFACDFPIAAESELDVTLISSAGVSTVQTLTTHYSVSISGDGTGTVTFVTAPAATDKVRIAGVTPDQQTASYTENDRFPAAAHEGSMDSLAKSIQEIRRDLSRVPKYPYGEASAVLAAAAARAGYLVGFNASSGALESSGILASVVQDLAALTTSQLADIATLADAIDNGGAVGGLEVTPDGHDTARTLSRWLSRSGQKRMFYVNDYITDATQLGYVVSGDVASQDESVIGAAIQTVELAALVWAKASPNRKAVLIYSGIYATDRPMQSVEHAEELWTFAASGNAQTSNINYYFEPGSEIHCKNFAAQKENRVAGGFYKEQSISDNVMAALFRWEQSTPWGILTSIQNMVLVGEHDLDTDPIAYKLRSVNDLMGLDIRRKNFANTGRWIEQQNNCDEIAGNVWRCGAQFTNCGGDGFLPSDVYVAVVPGAGTTTLTLVNSDGSAYTGTYVWPAGTGRTVIVQGVGANSSEFTAQIQTRTSDTVVVLDRQASASDSHANFSFGPITISTTADSTAATVPSDFTRSLVGEYVMILKAGSKVHTDEDLLVTRVTAHNTGTGAVTLANQARNSVSDAPCIVRPSEYVGKSDDIITSGGSADQFHNNDCQCQGLRIETGLDGYPAVSGVYQYMLHSQYIGGKWHGINANDRDFGANFAAAIFDVCKQFFIAGWQVEFGHYSDEYGKLIVIGERNQIDFSGNLGDSNNCDSAATIYIDPKAAGRDNCKCNIDAFINDPNFIFGNQASARYGPNGSAVNLRGKLDRRNAGTIHLPEVSWTPTLELGGVEVSTLGGAYTTQTGEIRHLGGGMVHVFLSIELSALGTATGNATIPLPAEIEPADFQGCLKSPYYGSVTSLAGGVFGAVQGGGTDAIAIRTEGTGGGGHVNVSEANLTNTTRIDLDGIFRIQD